MNFYDIAQSLSPCFILCTLYLFFRLQKVENLFIIYKKKQDDELAFIAQELKSMSIDAQCKENDSENCHKS